MPPTPVTDADELLGRVRKGLSDILMDMAALYYGEPNGFNVFSDELIDSLKEGLDILSNLRDELRSHLTSEDS